ncbi:hypothetical protein [Desulfococcus multivorans]|nr:hypothetical protein [Desulfococcus multivorans]
MMNPCDRSGFPEQKLAESVRRLFREGIRLNGAAWHFINSTFCHPSMKALENLLSDENNPEREPLFELIFFPDITQQAALEDEISEGGFADGDEARVLSQLTRPPLEARLIVPGEPDFLAIRVPEWATAAFLARLHIGKPVDARLAEAIDRFVPDTLRLGIRVGLRNARFAQTDKNVRFLCHFFKESAGLWDDFLAVVDYLTAFLDEIEDGMNIYKALSHRKRMLFRRLEEARRFEKQLERHNIETLMLQGARPPHIDKDQVRWKMAAIDRISQTVFGRIEPLGDDPVELVRISDDSFDIEDMIRSLS